MPTYTFYNKKTKKYFDRQMTMAEHEEFSKNPDYQQVPTVVGLHSGRGLGGGLKIDDGFNDVLKEIKKKHSGGFKSGRSTIQTK